MIQISIVEDHSLFLEGIKCLLQSASDFEVVSTHPDGESFLAALPDAQIVLLDIRMPGINGFEVLNKLLKENHPARVLFLTTYNHKLLVSRAKQRGAHGIIFKQDAVKDLKTGIDSVLNQSDFFTSRSLKGLDQERVKQLTPREEQVLLEIGKGHTNKEVSSLLEISVTTVNTYRSRLMLKLDAHNTADLTRIAHEIGILSPLSLYTRVSKIM